MTAPQNPVRIVLPRGNPGPEPWPEDRSPGGWVSLALFVILCAGLLAWRRGRSHPAVPLPKSTEVEQKNPQDPMLLQAEMIRAALARGFGPEWVAKTTEEIEGALLVDASLSAEHQATLVEILKQADRAKFSGAAVPSDHSGEGGPALSAALDAVAARSTRIGK